MKITALEEYGLRCLLALAIKGQGGQLTIPEVAAMEGLSEPYVGKLLTLLKKGDLIKSERGRNGGFSISRSSEEINLLEAVTALNGPIIEIDHCSQYSGQLDQCVHFDGCSVRYVLGGLVGYIEEFLSQTTLADVMKERELDSKEWLAALARPIDSPATAAANSDTSYRKSFEI